MFHSASNEDAVSILSNGFRITLNKDYFLQPLYADHGLLQKGMISMLFDSKEAGEFNTLELPLDLNHYERLVDLWLSHFGSGSLIWVMPDEPDPTYGDVHLEVLKLPPDATPVCRHSVLGWCFYTEENLIPKEFFRRV